MRSILCISNRSTSHHNSSAASSSSSSSSSSFRRKYHNDTPECDALLNLPAWTVDQFIRSYTDDTFHTLLASEGMADRSSVPPSLPQVHEQMMTTTTITAAAGSAAGDEKATTAAAAFLPRPDEDDLLWDGPNVPAWVACNQNNKTCYQAAILCCQPPPRACRDVRECLFGAGAKRAGQLYGRGARHLQPQQQDQPHVPDPQGSAGK
jgi:hypothetical protein